MRIDAELPPWWREVFEFTAPIPDAVADKVSAAGDGGLRAVCAVLDPAFGERPVPRPTQDARGFCAKILIRFARPGLVPWMLHLVRRQPDDHVVPYLADSLAACGSAATDAACASFADSEPGDPIRPWLAEIAAHAGSRTDEALAVLVLYLQDDPVHAAQLLADYGDPAAVAPLVMEFDATTTIGPDADPQTLVMLGSAIGALGGELDAARAERLDASEEEVHLSAVEQRRRMIEKGGFGAIERPEPDDPCPCESGRNYGECCSAVEAEMAERHRLRPPSLH
jgi:hypothetical protein